MREGSIVAIARQPRTRVATPTGHVLCCRRPIMGSDQVGLEIYGSTDVGRVRTGNEDAFVVADLMVPRSIYVMPHVIELSVGSRGVLLAVSDGMGGAQAGEVASALALHSLRRELGAVASRSAEDALTISVEQANRNVWDAAATSDRKGMGATMTAVFLLGTRAYVAEIGDSRAYVLRGSRLIQLTHDQSCVQLLVDNGTLTHEEAKTFAYRNIILQAIGTKPDVVVALNRFTLRRDDRILLCSDGLTNKVTDEEMGQIVASAATLDAACEQLIALANERGGEDNVTVVLAKMIGDGLPALTGEERVSLETVRAFSG